jgi:tetratricopeptide (TPR) repeat protein
MARDAAASWEQLVVEYPGVREYREGLAGLYTSLAHQLIGGGEMAEAEAVFRSAAAAWERLAADNPTVPRYAVQLSNTSLQVGERLHYSSNDTAALEWYTKAVESLTRIVTAHPRQADARGRLLLAYAFQATGFSRVRRNADALAAWDKALALDKDLALSPVRGQLRLGRLITTARLGQHAQAVAEAEAEVKGASFFLGASTHYNAACVYAGAVEGAAGDAALAERYAARAVQLLRQAVAKGYRAAAEMRTDRDLDPLRRRNDFAALLWDMAELPAR